MTGAMKTKFVSICSIRACDEESIRWLIRSITVDKKRLEAVVALCSQHLGETTR